MRVDELENPKAFGVGTALRDAAVAVFTGRALRYAGITFVVGF
jgi:hypothetical protein